MLLNCFVNIKISVSETKISSKSNKFLDNNTKFVINRRKETGRGYLVEGLIVG